MIEWRRAGISAAVGKWKGRGARYERAGSGEPRLASATCWYVTADSGEIDGLEFAYPSGNPGPQVESRSGWDVDGVEIRVILDFGAGFVDHRRWFMNPGA
jgi:hypothetical protein